MLSSSREHNENTPLFGGRKNLKCDWNTVILWETESAEMTPTDSADLYFELIWYWVPSASFNESLMVFFTPALAV